MMMCANVDFVKWKRVIFNKGRKEGLIGTDEERPQAIRKENKTVPSTDQACN